MSRRIGFQKKRLFRGFSGHLERIAEKSAESLPPRPEMLLPNVQKFYEGFSYKKNPKYSSGHVDSTTDIPVEQFLLTG